MYKLLKFLSFKKLKLLITGFKLGVFIISKRQQFFLYFKLIRNLKYNDILIYFRIIKKSIYKQLKNKF